jgi:signal peptidase I
MRWLPALVTLVLPGFGQAVANRTRRGVVWAVACLLVLVSDVWIPMMGFATLALHLAAAIDAAWCLRTTTTAPEWIRPSTYIVGGIGFAPVLVGLMFVRLFKVPSSSMYPTLHIGDHVAIDTLTPWYSPIARGDVIVHAYPCDRHRDYLKRVVAVAGDTVEVRCNVVYVNGVALANSLVDANHTYEDYDERNDRWFQRPCSMYRETEDGHTYDVFHDADRPDRDRKHDFGDGDSRDFPRRGEMPGCDRADDGNLHAARDLGTIVVTKADAGPCEPQAHYVVPPHAVFVLGDNRNNSNDSRVWGSVDVSAITGRVWRIWWARDKSRLGRQIE